MGFAGGALLALIFVRFLRISVSLRPLKERASLIGSWSDEALPIFFDKIFHPIVAVILSVTYVLAFGEIIPQAICTRYGLAVQVLILSGLYEF